MAYIHHAEPLKNQVELSNHGIINDPDVETIVRQRLQSEIELWRRLPSIAANAEHPDVDSVDQVAERFQDRL